jgi:hypothetical protein
VGTGSPREDVAIFHTGSVNGGSEQCQGSPPAPARRTMKTLSDEPKSGAPLPAVLPPLNPNRWVVSRKAAVVAAVSSGGMTIADACRVYQLSEEEFLSWARAFKTYGLAGLRATRIQQYRASATARTPFPETAN